MTFTEIFKDQVPSFSRSWWYVPRQAHSNSSVVIYKDGSDAHYIKRTESEVISLTLANLYCQVSLLLQRRDLPENLGKNQCKCT